MNTRRWPARIAAFAAVLALLLRAALPGAAAFAAQAQGKTLFEVCTVYGVKTVAVDALAGDSAEHGDTGCALALLTPGGAPAAAAGAIAAPTAPEPMADAAATRAAPADACAAWFARLRHAPPSSA